MAADEQPPAGSPPAGGGLSLPDTLLAIQSIPDAIDAYLAAGMRPIFTHAPIGTDGGCTCGSKHDISPSGSSSAGKHPIAKGWQKQPYSHDELRDQLLRLKFTPNVGVVLGSQPLGCHLLAVDVDDMPRFAALEAELGALPETPRCDSGRGYRLFYEAPPEVDATTLVNVTGLGGEKGVDVKSERGQVVVAPSLHYNGKRYFWSKVGPIARLPMPWALELVRTPPPPAWVSKYTPQTMQADAKAKKRAARYLEVTVIRRASELSACGEGLRNNTLFRSACYLFEICAGLYLAREWSYIHDQLFQAARASGLSEREVRRTIESADKRVRESGKVRVPVVLQHEVQPASVPSTAMVPSTIAGAEPAALSTEVVFPADAHQIAPSGRPIIRVGTELYENVNAVVAALRRDPDLYQRDGWLVTTARVSQDDVESSPHVESDDGALHRQLVAGSPQIREMGIPSLRERLTRVAVFHKYVESTDRWKPILPADSIVAAVRERGEFPGVRHLIGIVETPTLRPDGTIVQEVGHDRQTGYVYLPSGTFPIVIDEMATQEHAIWAFKFLSEIFEDFPYVNAAHRSVPIAAILTLIARPAILGSVPAILFDASTRGSGKTLQTDAIATVATGRGAPRMNYTSDEIELEKILGGYAIKGSPFICLDNVPTSRAFGGGPLDRCITARDKVELRVLGRSEIPTLSWRALIMATGNNMQLFGDTARRSMMARLEPTDENPEKRTKFKHDDLLAWVRAQRPRLVAAALLILRAYWRAGRPNMGCARWGSFEEWARLVPNAIVFAGGADPMKARPELDEEVDSETRAVRCFITRLHGMIGEDPFRVSAIIELLYRCERKRDENGHENDGLEDLRDAIETLVGRRGTRGAGHGTSVPDSVELGKRMSAFRGRIIAGLRMTSATGSGGILRWRITPTSTKDQALE